MSESDLLSLQTDFGSLAGGTRTDYTPVHFELNEEQFIVGIVFSLNGDGVKRILSYSYALYRNIITNNVNDSSGTRQTVTVNWGTTVAPETVHDWRAPDYHALTSVWGTHFVGRNMLGSLRFGAADMRVPVYEDEPYEGGFKCGDVTWSPDYGGQNTGTPTTNGRVATLSPTDTCPNAHVSSSGRGYTWIKGWTIRVNPGSGDGVIAIVDFMTQGLPLYIATYINPVSCCAKDYASSPGRTRVCGYIGRSPTAAADVAACQAELGAFCAQGNNFVTPTCREYCNAPGGVNSCDAIGEAYCLSLGLATALNTPECGCFMRRLTVAGTGTTPQPFYQAYYAQLAAQVPEMQGLGQNPPCTYFKCSQSPIKGDAYKRTLETCPNVTVCIQRIEIDNNGTIGPLTVEQKQECGAAAIAGTGVATQTATRTNTGTGAGTGGSGSSFPALGIAAIVLLVVLLIVGIAAASSRGRSGRRR